MVLPQQNHNLQCDNMSSCDSVGIGDIICMSFVFHFFSILEVINDSSSSKLQTIIAFPFLGKEAGVFSTVLIKYSMHRTDTK